MFFDKTYMWSTGEKLRKYDYEKVSKTLYIWFTHHRDMVCHHLSLCSGKSVAHRIYINEKIWYGINTVEKSCCPTEKK